MSTRNNNLALREGMAALGSLFLPELCPACGNLVAGHGSLLCTACHWDIPLTGYWDEADNPVSRKFWGHVPIAHVSAFMFFSAHSPLRNLVHSFKYRGGWRTALKMGRWYGEKIAGSTLHAGIDIVVPVPLHIRRRLSRGYNQSEYIAEGIARTLGVPCDSRTIRRRVNNPSQTHSHDPEQRWQNVEGIFAVRDPERLAGKHILLVDDVLTTGATLIACAETILKATPTAKLSIATLATTQKPPGQT